MLNRIGRHFAAVLLLTMVVPAIQAANPLSIVPLPQQLTLGEGQFVFNTDTCLVSDPALTDTANFLRGSLQTAAQLELPEASEERTNCVVMMLDAKLPEESYTLTVDRRSVRIAAAGNAGAFYAVQTLRQLLPNAIYADSPQLSTEWFVPAVSISDQPRFSWRGMHLDVGRHFMPPAFIKKFIDTLALHKLNVFHWHLTEDQGWRIEIKQYPKLTDVGAWRDGTLIGSIFDNGEIDNVRHGGFYSQDRGARHCGLRQTAACHHRARD